ncbi:MAG: hypothetical protein ACE5FD_19760 [Anaerolineae bacterium]
MEAFVSAQRQAGIHRRGAQLNYLMIDGHDDPNTSQAYREAVEALYILTYALKFKMKKGEVGLDYAVMPLEGLW